MVADILIGFSSPRSVGELICLQHLGKLLRALIEVILKEPGSMRELRAIMQVSHLLFSFDGNRKVYLASEIDQHRVWQNHEAWKLCLQKTITLKFHEAVEQLQK